MTIDVLRLSNDDLIANTKKAAANERHATVDLVALVAEAEAREFHLGQGLSSLFAYCTRVLHLSEDAARRRMEAARKVRRVPVILDRVASGELTPHRRGPAAKARGRRESRRSTRPGSSQERRIWRPNPTSLRRSGGHRLNAARDLITSPNSRRR